MPLCQRICEFMTGEKFDVIAERISWQTDQSRMKRQMAAF